MCSIPAEAVDPDFVQHEVINNNFQKYGYHP